MTEYTCPKCGRRYMWIFDSPRWDPESSIVLYAVCNCVPHDGEMILTGDEFEKHKRYIADQIFWKRASDEQKLERMREENENMEKGMKKTRQRMEQVIEKWSGTEDHRYRPYDIAGLKERMSKDGRPSVSETAPGEEEE